MRLRSVSCFLLKRCSLSVCFVLWLLFVPLVEADEKATIAEKFDVETCNSLCFSPNGGELAATGFTFGGEGKLLKLAVPSLKRLSARTFGKDVIPSDPTFSANGKELAILSLNSEWTKDPEKANPLSTFDQEIVVLNSESLFDKPLRTVSYKATRSAILHRIFYDGNGLIAVIDNPDKGECELLETTTAKTLATFRPDFTGIGFSPVAISRNAKRLALTSHRFSSHHLICAIWDTTGKLVSRLEDEDQLQGTCLALDSEGQRLAVGTQGGFLLLWSVAERRLIWSRKMAAGKSSEELQMVSFSANDKHLVVGRADGQLQVLDVQDSQGDVLLRKEEVVTFAVSPIARILAIARRTAQNSRMIELHSY